MQITRTQQTALSLPEHMTKTQENNISNVWVHGKVEREPADVLSLGSTRDGWKHIREVRQTRENILNRTNYRTNRSTVNKRLYETADGGMGWLPDQATQEETAWKKIRAQRQIGDLTGRKSQEISGVIHSASLPGKVSNHSASTVDYRLPKTVAKRRRSLKHGADGTGTSQSSTGGSVNGKPFLRYNHGNKERGIKISQKCRLEDSTGRNGRRTSSDQSLNSGSPDESNQYNPFYPVAPSSSPASSYSSCEFDVMGMDSNIHRPNVGGDQDLYTEDGEGYLNSIRSPTQGTNHAILYDEGPCLEPSDTDMKNNIDEAVFSLSMPHPAKYTTLPKIQVSRITRREVEPGVDSYRDAYTRALAVAQSRRLPDEFTGLGTLMTPAYTFSYFTHVPSCKCPNCLERIVLRDSPMKNNAKKRKQPEGLKLILGDVELEDNYR